MLTHLAPCILLAVYAAAFEMYDEYHYPIGFDQDEDIVYSEENYNYLEPGQFGPELRDNAVQDLMIYQLFNSLRNKDDVHLQTHYRPKWNMVENPLTGFAHLPYPGLIDPKGTITKRHADASVPIQMNKQKPVNKDNKSKGNKMRRLGSHIICYFKLCSFRYPF